MPCFRGLLQCCTEDQAGGETILKSYSDSLSDGWGHPIPLLRFPNVDNNVPGSEAFRTLRVNSKEMRSIEDYLGQSYFKSLERFEIRLSKALNLARISPFLLRHRQTLETVCLRCVGPPRSDTDEVSENDDSVRRAIRVMFTSLERLTNVSISVDDRNATSPNSHIPKVLSTELCFAKHLRILKLSCVSFTALDLSYCDLDIHTIELDEIATHRILYSDTLEAVNLKAMNKLVKVIVRTKRRLELSEDNKNLRKLVICHVKGVQGDVSTLTVLSVANFDEDCIRSLLQSTAASLEEIGLYAEGQTCRLDIDAISLKVLFLQGITLESIETSRESPLEVLCLRSVTIVAQQHPIYAKQILLIGKVQEICAALRPVSAQCVQSLAIERVQQASEHNTDESELWSLVNPMKDNLLVFATNSVLPADFPPLPKLKRFYGKSLKCLKRVHRKRTTCFICTSACSDWWCGQYKLDELGLSPDMASLINDPVCQKKAERRVLYHMPRHFWFEALRTRTNLITDASWNGLTGLWQWLLPSEKQGKLFGHGEQTRSAATPGDTDLEQK